MTAAGLKYLMAIDALGASGIKITEIAESMSVSKVSVYRAISRLETGGYTVRDEKNRVVITEYGRSQLEKYTVLLSCLEYHFKANAKLSEGNAREDAINAICAVSDECREAIYKAFMQKIVDSGASE